MMNSSCPTVTWYSKDKVTLVLTGSRFRFFRLFILSWDHYSLLHYCASIWYHFPSSQINCFIICSSAGLLVKILLAWLLKKKNKHVILPLFLKVIYLFPLAVFLRFTLWLWLFAVLLQWNQAWFSLYLSCLQVIWDFLNLWLKSFIIFWTFLTTIPSYGTPASLSLLSFWDTRIMYIRLFHWVLYVCYTVFCILLFSPLSMSFNMNIFYWANF